MDYNINLNEGGFRWDGESIIWGEGFMKGGGDKIYFENFIDGVQAPET